MILNQSLESFTLEDAYDALVETERSFADLKLTICREEFKSYCETGVIALNEGFFSTIVGVIKKVWNFIKKLFKLDSYSGSSSSGSTKNKKEKLYYLGIMETKFSDFVSIGHDYLDQHLFIDDLTQTIRMKSKFIDQLFDTIKTDTFTNELIEKYDDIGTNLFRRYSLNVGMPGEQNMFKIETFFEAKGSTPWISYSDFEKDFGPMGVQFSDIEDTVADANNLYLLAYKKEAEQDETVKKNLVILAEISKRFQNLVTVYLKYKKIVLDAANKFFDAVSKKIDEM